MIPPCPPLVPSNPVSQEIWTLGDLDAEVKFDDFLPREIWTHPGDLDAHYNLGYLMLNCDVYMQLKTLMMAILILRMGSDFVFTFFFDD